MNNTSPCTYSPERAIDNSKPDYQKACMKILPPSKHTLNFVEVTTKLKKIVPAPNTYNITDKVMDKIYKGASPRYKLGRWYRELIYIIL